MILPDSFFTHLNYDFHNYQLLATAASGTLLVAGNSAYDPDKTGAGHQPLGYDQFSLLYTRYRVHGSQILLTLLRADNQCVISMTPTIDSTVPATVNDSLESPYNKRMVISSSVFKMSTNSSMMTKKLWGFTNIEQDDLFSTLTNNDPTRIWYWKIQAQSWDGSSTTSLWIEARITYDIEFFGRINFTQS